MVFRQWITSEQLISRWRCWPFQLAQAWKEGLPVYSAYSGAKQLAGQSCLECAYGSDNGEAGCDDGKDLCLGYTDTIMGEFGPEEISTTIDIGAIGERFAKGALTFDLAEVEAFELAHGLRVNQPEPAEGAGLEEESLTKRPDLTTRERRTHQAIIAALCKKAGIEWEVRGAATKISQALDGIGISVDDDTIRKILKEIPESIEARTR